MDEHVDYLGFIVRLRHLVQSGASVTLRMVTDDRHFVNIGLDRGRIVSVYHGPRRGMRALERIKGLGGGGLSLLPAQELHAPQDLPSTQEILGLLEEGQAGQFKERTAPAPARAGSAVPPQPVAAEPPAPRASLNNQDVVEALFRMEEELLRLIGPIAKMVVKETVRELGQVGSRDDLVQLAHLLSREIDDPAQARRFTDQALARL